MINFGKVAAGTVLYVPFHTFNAAGASVTLTGLAVTDIEIYKNGSTTQRASDNGYTLLDTDGIDFDGITGIHGFSVDTSDNSDAGFYSAGGFYWIVISAVTVDAQTVNFVAGVFGIEPAIGINVNVVANAGTAITSASGIQEVKVASIAANAITATSIAADAITDAKVASDVTIASVTGAVGSVTGNVGGNVTGSVGSVATGGIAAASFAANAITATAIAADAITDAKVASDVTIASVTGAVGSVTGAVGSVTGAVGSVTGNVGGNVTGTVGSVVGAVGSVTGNVGGNVVGTVASVVGAVGSVTGLTASDVGAIKAKTDNLPGDPADASDIASAFGTVNTTLGTIAGYIDTEVTAIKLATDKLAGMTEVGAGSPTYYRWQAVALELAPTGGSAPSAATIADAVWDELLSGHAISGSTGEALSDIPTNAELATALGTADDAVLAQVALVKAKTDNLPSDPADASVVAGLIAAVETKVDTVDTVVDAVKVQTDKLTFTVANQIDANVQYVNDTQIQGTGAVGSDEWRKV